MNMNKVTYTHINGVYKMLKWDKISEHKYEANTPYRFDDGYPIHVVLMYCDAYKWILTDESRTQHRLQSIYQQSLKSQNHHTILNLLRKKYGVLEITPRQLITQITEDTRPEKTLSSFVRGILWYFSIADYFYYETLNMQSDPQTTNQIMRGQYLAPPMPSIR